MKLTQSSQLLIAFIFISVTLFSSCEEVVVTSPVQTISFEEANRLEETYKQTRATILNDTLGYEDTREFWFSLDTLKKYISYVKNISRIGDDIVPSNRTSMTDISFFIDF